MWVDGFFRSVLYFILLVRLFFTLFALFPSGVIITLYVHTMITELWQYVWAANYILKGCQSMSFVVISVQFCCCLCSHIGQFANIRTSTKKKKKSYDHLGHKCIIALFSFLFSRSI